MKIYGIAVYNIVLNPNLYFDKKIIKTVSKYYIAIVLLLVSFDLVVIKNVYEFFIYCIFVYALCLLFENIFANFLCV